MQFILLFNTLQYNTFNSTKPLILCWRPRANPGVFPTVQGRARAGQGKGHAKAKSEIFEWSWVCRATLLLHPQHGTVSVSCTDVLLPRCMECRRCLAMRILSVCLSVCLSNAWIVAKRKKDLSRGCTRDVQVKLCDPLRMRAISERLRGTFTTRRYTNPRLPYLTYQIFKAYERSFNLVF